MDFEAALRALGTGALAGRPVIIASNRGPVEYHDSDEGLIWRRGQGGLVTAVSAVAARLPATWVSAPLSAVDQRLASEGRTLAVPVADGGPDLQVRFVAPAPAEFRGYYDQIANALLWFLQHGVHHAPESPDIGLSTWGAWHAYRQVNRRFDQTDARPLILLHDYHLYLVPGLLRQALPGATIQHFTHISWPHPEQWHQLPSEMRHSLIRSLLAADVLGFNTRRYAEAFAACSATFLGATVDGDRVRYAGRDTRVKGYPVSIDVAHLQAFADSPTVLAAETRLFGDQPDHHRIVQVARTDPSKNVLRAFKAIDLVLQTHPDLAGRIVYYGLLPTSRQTCEKYQDYLAQLRTLAATINRRHRTGAWKPIRLFLDNDYGRGIAAMKQYDALLVNSLADGMNLVAKEGPVVNRRHGVLILSETAGVADELAPWSLMVNPYDIHATAQAIWRALTLAPQQRQQFHAAQQRFLLDHDVFRWAYEQLADLLAAESACATAP
jgi:trehalose 6-phosphate synthase